MGTNNMTRLKAEYPETGSDVLENYVNEDIFKTAKEKAIDSTSIMAFLIDVAYFTDT